ncbi:MAG: hypothetical protein WC799_21680 [Desulfobacteraceae bacterium]|jgi:hypothetical protein
MLLSSWKSREELEFMLSGMRQVAVFSCSFCANLNGTGGPEALDRMKGLLKDLGIKAVVVKMVNICCSEEIMKQAVRIHLSKVRGACDGLVMMSCAGGVKTAFLCDPGMPVIAALDSMGSGVITRKKGPGRRQPLRGLRSLRDRVHRGNLPGERMSGPKEIRTLFEIP